MTVKTIVFFHLYPIKGWKKITQELFQQLSDHRVAVHLSISPETVFNLPAVLVYLNGIEQVKWICWSVNGASAPEAKGLEKLRYKIDIAPYSWLIYLHSKGVTKPHNKNIKDWRLLMSHFLFQRKDLLDAAFNKGYKLYGVNLCQVEEDKPKDGPKKFSPFWFRGNYVAVNLDLIRDKFIETPIDKDYFGVEGFWGKLCAFDEAFSPHNSGISHYKFPYPKEYYVNNYRKP